MTNLALIALSHCSLYNIMLAVVDGDIFLFFIRRPVMGLGATPM
jgi:hypothetical protein